MAIPPAETQHPAIAAFDLRTLPADFIADPYRYFSALRAERPVHRMPDGSYLVTRHADLVAVYRDPAQWRSDKTIDFKPKFGASPLYEHHTTSLVFRDPPDHTRIRRLFQAAFAPKALAALEPRIERLVDSYLDTLAERKTMDIVAEFSFVLPVQVVCDMLGVPAEDRLLIRDWALAILGALEPSLGAAELSAGNRAVEDFKAYLRALIAHRKRHPTDGSSGEVLTALIEAGSDGERLGEVELLHQCIFLLNAGHETSTNMISHGVNELLRHPAEFARLRREPALIESCVEEVLRFQAPIQINNRRAAAGASLGGVAVPAGAIVHLMIGSANRDGAQFPEPDRFDIARRPNRHLAFGLGIHICAGNTLARIEARIAFARLVARFPELRLAAPARLAPRVRFREIAELRVAA
jgi:hypothetical protein